MRNSHLCCLTTGNERGFLRTGDYIVVVNAKKLRVTGNKAKQKMYYRHSTYPGGIYSSNFSKLGS